MMDDPIRWYNIPYEEREIINMNPMCEAFPRVAACTYHRYGTGGGEERKQAICILGKNNNLSHFLKIMYSII